MTQFVDVSEAMSDCRIHRDEASGLMVLDVSATEPLADYRQAIEIANRVTRQHFGEVMMLSWYDRTVILNPPSTPVNAIWTALSRDMLITVCTMAPIWWW